MSTPTFTSIIVNQQEVHLDHQGDWNATTNSPALSSGTGTIGHTYRVSVAGSFTLDGESSWDVDDQLYFDGSAWVKVTVGGGGSSLLTQTNKVFVSKAGNDSNDGLTEATALLTIGQALVVAATLGVGASNRVAIHIVDGGIYQESVSLPSYVSIFGPAATLEGAINTYALNPGIESFVHLHRIIGSTGTIGGAIRCNSLGKCWIKVDEVICLGTGTIPSCFTSTVAAEAFLDIGRMEVATGRALQAGTAYVYGSVGQINITSTGVGIYMAGAGNLDLKVGAITEDATATMGVDLQVTGAVANIEIGRLDTTNSYEVAAGATLNLFVGKLTGTPGPVSGVVNLTEAGAGGGGGGLSNRRIARLVQTTNIADLAAGAPDTVDGVSVALNDRILVEGQTLGQENGIYVVDTVGTGSDGSWSRAGDFDDAVVDSIQAGIEVYIQEGTAYERSTFFLVTTGAITIGTTPLEFLLEGGLARTDASSTEVIASTAFAATYVVSSDIDMRDHTHLAVFFDPTDITGVTQADIVVFWSDDGTTVPFATDDNLLQSDFDIVNQSDGSFNPKPYTARFTTSGGELAANKRQHLIFPKAGGVCRVGVLGDAAGGAFSVRTQRVTR